MTAAQIAAVLGSLSMPVLLLMAGEQRMGHDEWMSDLARRYIDGVSVESVPGPHHFHMEDGVGMVAQYMNDFFTAANERRNEK